MIVSGFFDERKDVISWMKMQAKFLPEDVALTHAGASEGRITEHEIIRDKSRFKKFVDKNNSGFFLFNKIKKSISADIDILDLPIVIPEIFYSKDDNRSGISRILAKHAMKIIESYAKAGAFFAYACLDEEWHFKNQAKVVFKKGPTTSIEAMVGNNARKYLRGIFWLTWLADDYAARVNINPQDIASRLDIKIVSMRTGKLLSLGANPESWTDKTEQIKSLSMDAENIFHLDKIDLSKVKTVEDFDRVTDPWSFQTEW